MCVRCMQTPCPFIIRLSVASLLPWKFLSFGFDRRSSSSSSWDTPCYPPTCTHLHTNNWHNVDSHEICVCARVCTFLWVSCRIKGTEICSVCAMCWVLTIQNVCRLRKREEDGKKERKKMKRKLEKNEHVNDRGREGGGEGGVERLNVSTWLVIQCDYHRLTAPTGRHPWLLRLASELPLKCAREWKRERGEAWLCVWDESAVDEPQTDLTPTPQPHITNATQGTRSTSRVRCARRPPVQRRQLVEAAASWATTGRGEEGAECKLSN